MILNIVYYAIATIIKINMKKKEFRNFIAGYECSVVFKTRKNKNGKRFVFKDGKFFTDNKINDYDAALIFTNQIRAFIRLALQGTEQAIYDAVNKHEATIDGTLLYFQWFGAVLQYVMGRTRPR